MTDIEYIKNKKTRESVQSCTVPRKTFAWPAELVLCRGLSAGSIAKIIRLADPLLYNPRKELIEDQVYYLCESWCEGEGEGLK